MRFDTTTGVRNAPYRLAFVAMCALAIPAPAGVSPDRLARLDDFLDTYVDEGKVPGVVLQVTHDGRTVYHRAAGSRDRETEAPMQTDTPDGNLARPDASTAFHGQGHYVTAPRRSFSGGAGLVSTTADYTRFLEVIRRGGEPILSRKSVELMTTDNLGDIAAAFPGGGFGLGFGTVSDPGLRGQLGSRGEFNWGGAYHTSYWVDPVEKLTVVYMTQVLPAWGLDDFGKVRALVYQAID